MNEKKSRLAKEKESKLPFAVFINPNNQQNGKIENYKEIFTDIISDRIKQKYK